LAFKREAGYITVSDPGADKPIFTAMTLQCVHCGGHWFPEPGSGKVRGLCYACNGPICGPGCAKCVPTEVLLENYEKGRDLDYRPIVAPAFQVESDSPLAAATSFWTPGG
jgi:hypothetical protein